VEAPSGRRRRTTELTEVVNFPVQCTAAEMTHVAAILAGPALKSLYGARLILHVHDSLVFLVPPEHLRKAAATLEGIMTVDVPVYFRRHLGVGIPFRPRVEVGAGWTWGDLTEVEELLRS